jgi:hypothetical protein
MPRLWVDGYITHGEVMSTIHMWSTFKNLERCSDDNECGGPYGRSVKDMDKCIVKAE